MQMYNKSLQYSNRMLRSRMTGGGRLLDVGGAENPHRANVLADLFSEVIIADLKPPCAQLKANVRFMECAIENICPDVVKNFDHILLSNVLEHIRNPIAGLQAMTSSLKPSGTIHILSPNCESLNRRIGVQMGILTSIREITQREKKIGHLHMLTVADVTAMIANVGLVLCECVGVFLKPVPTPEMIQWPEDRIQAFFEIAPQIQPDLCHEVYFRAKHQVCIKNGDGDPPLSSGNKNQAKIERRASRESFVQLS